MWICGDVVYYVWLVDWWYTWYCCWCSLRQVWSRSLSAFSATLASLCRLSWCSNSDTRRWSSAVDCCTHSLANRHSCSTPAEMQDRKCFSMQLILVVGKVDMINQICQMLSFCWKLLSAYFAEKKWLLSTLLSTVVTAKCACIQNTNVCYFQCMHADQVGQHFNLRPNFKL